MNINQKVKSGYDKVAQAYASGFRDRFGSEIYLDKLITVLPPGASVLDVGCGSGRPVDSYLILKGLKVTGIDISEAQVALATSSVPQAEYRVRDMSELKEGDYSVDAVVSFYAIFHTPREKHGILLSTFRSFLKPGGYLLITMGASEWEGKEDNFCGTEMYWSHYGAAKNLTLVREAGFDMEFSNIDRSGEEQHLIILAKAR